MAIKLELTQEEFSGLADDMHYQNQLGVEVGQIIESGEVSLEIVCSDCHGTGEIPTDDSDGEGHTMRGVGTQKCQCD